MISRIGIAIKKIKDKKWIPAILTVISFFAFLALLYFGLILFITSM